MNKIKHLGLDGRVQAGGWLVQDEQLRISGERHGDHDPLLLPTGELVRVAPEDLAGVRNPDFFEHGTRFFEGRSLVHLEVLTVHFGDLRPHPHRGVEGAGGVLVHHRHPAAAPAAQRGLVGLQQVLAREHYPAGVHDGVLWEVAHERHRHRRLAAARLADEAIGLAQPDREIEVLDYAQRAPTPEVADREPLDADGRIVWHDAHSSTACRSPSATRLIATTSVASANAGKSTIHGAACR
jgi:hypothetical protein